MVTEALTRAFDLLGYEIDQTLSNEHYWPIHRRLLDFFPRGLPDLRPASLRRLHRKLPDPGFGVRLK